MKDSKISARQTGMLCVLLILANSILVTPSILYKEVGADGFWVMLALSIVDVFVLSVFFMLKSKYPTESFYEVLKMNVGKVVAKIILIGFLIFFLFKSLFTYSVVYMYLNQQVYQDQFQMLALICFIPIINHAVLVGLRAFSRTIELFFYVVLTGVLVCIAMSFTNSFGLPLFFQTTMPKFFYSMFKHVFSFGNYLFLFLIMDKIDLRAKEGRRILNFSALGIALVLSILFRFYSMFRITAFMHNNAIADISMVSAEYASLGKLDVISMITVVFLSYFQLEIFVYGFCTSFCNIFTKLNKVHAVITYDILFFILQVLLLSQYDFFVGATESYLPFIVIFVNYLVPIILAFLTIKSKRQYQKLF